MAETKARNGRTSLWQWMVTRWRTHTPDQQPLIIGNRRIYVLPTRFGLFIGMVLATLNLGSLNNNNNAALLLGFLLISLAINALIRGHLTLLGLKLQAQPPESVFAGQALALSIAISPRGHEPRMLMLQHDKIETSITLAAESTSTQLSIATQRRGYFCIDRIRIATLHPLGLARAWCDFRLQQRVIVYPAPRGEALLAHFPSRSDGHGRQSRSPSEQPHHLRAYRHGDSRKQIAWKASARAGSLHVREYEQGNSGDLLLDWDQLAHLAYEARISQICLWVLHAEQQQRRYALHLPGQCIPSGTGATHQMHCLEALALLPEADDA